MSVAALNIKKVNVLFHGYKMIFDRAGHDKRTRWASPGDECPICLERTDHTTLFTLCCGHGFHAECATKVKGGEMGAIKCPICRQVSAFPPRRRVFFVRGERKPMAHAIY